MIKRAFLGILLLTLIGCNSPEDEQTPNIPATPVALETRVAAENLDHPWELVWGPDNWIWFTERDGNIGRLNPETGEVIRIHTIDEVWQQSESGLLGMALHPNFPGTPHLFVVYTYDENGTKQERVVRYTYTGSGLTEKTILLDGIKAYQIHDGSRLLIHEGKLFITTGDAGDQGTPQNKNSLNGKVLRINLDGSIPSDNPMPGSVVWSWGHRNPQGLTLGANGIMYSSEHGPGSDDEMNIIEKNRNYGWPNVMGYCNSPAEQTFCQANNVVEPITAWSPTLAVSGTAYYGKDLIPQWKNSLLMLTLKERELVILNLSSDGRTVDSITKAFDNEFGRLRGICVAPDGRVFFSTNDEGNDKVIEIRPKPQEKPRAKSGVVN
jgi:aldose sugar dehydrogenase